MLQQVNKRSIGVTPEDIIWGYGILHQKSYGQILAMLDRYGAIPKPAGTKEAPDVFTAEVKEKLEPPGEFTDEAARFCVGNH